MIMKLVCVWTDWSVRVLCFHQRYRRCSQKNVIRTSRLPAFIESSIKLVSCLSGSEAQNLARHCGSHDPARNGGKGSCPTLGSVVRPEGIKKHQTQRRACDSHDILALQAIMIPGPPCSSTGVEAHATLFIQAQNSASFAPTSPLVTSTIFQ